MRMLEWGDPSGCDAEGGDGRTSEMMNKRQEVSDERRNDACLLGKKFDEN